MATYENADDQFVTVNGERHAYRRLGPARGIPLVMLMGFRGTMDHWHPALVNALAAQRSVLLLDNPGTGRCTGPAPKTYTDWAAAIAAVLAALHITQIDLLGYSMGGLVAQLIALNAKGLVRRLILAGTSVSVGPGVKQFSEPGERVALTQLGQAGTEEEHRAAFLAGFFMPTAGGQKAGVAAWERICGGRPGRVRADYVGGEAARRQGIAFMKFMDPKQAGMGSFDRLREITVPVLVAGGKEDLLMPTENSIALYKKLSNAQLHLYPDSGHGFLYQYAQDFATLVYSFLDGPEGVGVESKL